MQRAIAVLCLVLALASGCSSASQVDADFLLGLVPVDATNVQASAQAEYNRYQLRFDVKRTSSQPLAFDEILGRVRNVGWRTCTLKPAEWEDFGERVGDTVKRVRQRLNYFIKPDAVLTLAERIEGTGDGSPVTAYLVMQRLPDEASVRELLARLQIDCTAASK